MSNVKVNIEFLAGTSIKQAITEAKQKAILWDVAYVCFNFNGVSMSIGKNADIDEGVALWENAMESEREYKSAVVN